MALTYTNGAFPTSGVIQYTDFSSRFTDIQNKFAGGIVDADIAANATIVVSKLSASTEHLVVSFGFKGTLAAGWPAAGTICTAGLHDDTLGNWEATGMVWSCTDTGGGTGTFTLRWGTLASGAFVSTVDVSSSTTITNGASGANSANCGEASFNTALTAGTARVLAVIATGADGTTLAGAADATFNMSVYLRRVITNG